MSRVEVTQPSTPLSKGILQTILPLSATSQFVKDNVGNTSALSLGTVNVGIGTSAPVAKLDIVSDAGGQCIFTRYGGQPQIQIRRSQGTFAAPTAVVSGASSLLAFANYDGTSFGTSAAIQSIPETQTPTAKGASLALNVVSAGTTSLINGLIINSAATTPASVSISTNFGSPNSRLTVWGTALAPTIPYFDIVNSGGGQLLKVSNAGNLLIGNNTTSDTAKISIQGSGSTSATTSLLVQNSAGTELLKTTDAGLTNIRTLSFFDGNASMSGASPGTILCNINPQTATPSGFIVRTNANLIGNSSANAFAVDVNSTKLFSVTQTSQVLIGSGTVNASAVLQIDSTTQGFLPPRMTTAQKNAIATPAEGLIVYDTTLRKLCVRGAATWETITSI